jgi:hypothetical protein
MDYFNGRGRDIDACQARPKSFQAGLFRLDISSHPLEG